MTSTPPHPPRDSAAIAALIDHTLLKPEATGADIARLCAEAEKFKFASVCVNPVFTAQVSEILQNSVVKSCAVVGFPLGANLTGTKLVETRSALRDGAVCEAAHAANAICKVIIEPCLLNEEEKVRACRISATSGADFVKTSTGFSTSGATAEDVALMRTVVGPHIGVKASGGIRMLDDLLKMVAAGATRIGSSNGAKILEEARQRFGS